MNSKCQTGGEAPNTLAPGVFVKVLTKTYSYPSGRLIGGHHKQQALQAVDTTLDFL